MRGEYDFSQARKNPYIINNEWHLCTSVESDPGLHSGAWVFRGTRVPISALFENLRDGLTDFIDPSFEVEVAKKVRVGKLERPAGNLNPEFRKTEVSLIARDLDVKAWVLIHANGVCENCNCKAPFISTTGIPYLEVHHVKRLADKGPDTTDNTVALCPNCHKALHYSEERSKIVESLYNRIPRLKR